MQNSRGVIVLAAGQGKRMHSSVPKVLNEIAGRPMVVHILNSIRAAAPDAPVAVVVGVGREQVEARIRADESLRGMDLTFVHQAEQKGTGHATRCAMDSAWGKRVSGEKSSVLVVPGDQPLMSAALMSAMLAPLARGTIIRLLTTDVPDPSGLGRVVRKGKAGPVQKIVEEKDATAAQKKIHEVAMSTYLFNGAFLKKSLAGLSNKNAQGEYYLTDVLTAAVKARKKIDVLHWADYVEVLGVNNQWELARQGALLNQRIVKEWAVKGVRIQDLANTWIDSTVELAPGVELQTGAVLRGKTTIGAGTVVGPRCVLSDMQVGENVELKTGTVAEESEIQNDAKVGPYAHLRPGSVVGPKAKIGNFVELKKARIGEATSVAHLSYLGDAEVGKRVNIGCGFVTCNFDGRVINGERKHRTVIEDDVFMGSDCQTVAPVRVGRGAYVASGSTVTEDVEADALAIARSRQVTKKGYAAKLRAQAEAAGANGAGQSGKAGAPGGAPSKGMEKSKS